MIYNFDEQILLIDKTYKGTYAMDDGLKMICMESDEGEEDADRAISFKIITIGEDVIDSDVYGYDKDETFETFIDEIFWRYHASIVRKCDRYDYNEQT